VIGTKSEKLKYELFYLAQNGNTQKITSFNQTEEISCLSVFVPTEDNIDERSIEILFGTNLSTIYYGRFYIEKKGNFKTEMAISEVYEISPKRKIYDICSFRTENDAR
jgi:hypothetical protein